VKLFREKNARIRYLNYDEIRRLYFECPAFLRPIVFTALNTGMRAGEIFNLKWQDLDLLRGLVYLEDTKKRGKERNTDK